ncbi:uncharacterized protein C9orf43 homolog [Trachypithecus francoisi]|uniref:uncharacterized protein C9orf43 homolog n=1 Tax=Trachypithecus francoisi TaxID=54180 RepID=UPI00141BE622|nr:uncharacterized protein C9orf43 homolog [Trachypithecus francoisi]XP_033093633.1 uncharacterized protein C9orf43 homolog [Trachypithecus francoisi]XP_033093634.1 uncharacterized protein C9orf43 homolog [Trachypithecus francoisi]
MDLPDESQWDETTCGFAVCQHPQCWATICRIERGHPRILGSTCKTPLDAEDKLPVLTVVNISDSCFAPRHLPECTFTKARSLLSRSSKFYSKFHGRPPKGLPDKSWINCTNRLPKLPVLNLNETQLPCPEDVRNMVVLWIPEETEIHVSQHGKKKRKNLTVKSKSFLGLSGNQSTETRVGTPGVTVPPPTPVQLSEQFTSDFLSLWAQSEALPQDLLKELLPDGKQTMPSLEMKIKLAMMKKNPPLERNRPDSAISSKMFLSIHRLTLERPALRYPERLKKLHNLKTEGYRKQQQWQQQQQQRKVKTPIKKQEAKKKAKSDPGSQSTSHKHPVTTVHDPLYGYGTLPGQNSDRKQQQQQMEKGTTSKQDSTERPKMDYCDHVDFHHNVKSPELYETEPTNKDISAPVEAVLEAQAVRQKKISFNFSEIMARTGWNSELRLLRILQDTDDEDEENQSSEAEKLLEE